VILDTNFLIQLEREITKRIEGPASNALESFLSKETLHITDTIAGELASGESLSERKRWETFIRPYPILESGRESAWHYGCIVRDLKRTGTLIGASDLWIAATALSHGMGVVTRNIKDFQRVPGLIVRSY